MSLTDYRCPDCGWWLFAADVTVGRVLMVCPRRGCSSRPDRVEIGFLEASGRPMSVRRCRNCAEVLLSTDAPFGRINALCQGRQGCKLKQTVMLGRATDGQKHRVDDFSRRVLR